jgi:fibronectin type 3 domain-containing protein
MDVYGCGDTCYAELIVCSLPPDTTSPESIDDLMIALESGSKSSSGDMRLIWTEPYDDEGVVRYVIYRDTSASSSGDSLAGTTDTTYIDMGVAGTVGTNYFYTVKAVDAAGNKSEQSNKVGEFERGLITLP